LIEWTDHTYGLLLRVTEQQLIVLNQRSGLRLPPGVVHPVRQLHEGLPHPAFPRMDRKAPCDE